MGNGIRPTLAFRRDPVPLALTRGRTRWEIAPDPGVGFSRYGMPLRPVRFQSIGTRTKATSRTGTSSPDAPAVERPDNQRHHQDCRDDRYEEKAGADCTVT